MFISFETGKILKSQKFQIAERKSAYNFLFKQSHGCSLVEEIFEEKSLWIVRP